jgi:DNA-binding transcriptional MerR regulator
MGMQQLDLFAAFAAPQVKEEPVEVKAVVAEPEQPKIVTPEPLIEVQPEPIVPISPAKEESLVFADEKIAVKIKPKVSVQMPKPQPQQVVVTPARQINVATTITETVVKPKSKRGRKSYKEIDAELDLIEVPDEETLSQKMYYSITEVAKWFKVNASLLRYWENEFDILKPRKNRKGDRLFRPEDIKNLQVIYYLLRNRKFSLEGAKKYLRNHRQQADVNVQLAQSLTKFRSFLLELKANLGA